MLTSGKIINYHVLVSRFSCRKTSFLCQNHSVSARKRFYPSMGCYFSTSEVRSYCSCQVLMTSKRVFIYMLGSISFVDTSSEDDVDYDYDECGNSPARLKHQLFGHWYDARNWKSHSQAVPHLQRVPCRYDTAVFPPKTAFKMTVADLPVDISSLKISNVPVATQRLRALYNGGDGLLREIGQMMVQLNESLTVHEDTCPHEDEQCQCFRSEEQEKLICSMTTCPQYPECSSALKPLEHCCYDVCGAIINIRKPWNSVDIPFNARQAERDLRSILKPSGRSFFPQRGKFKVLQY